MTDLPLFYRSVVPLNRDNHRSLRLAEPVRFGFARHTHLIPAVVDEFAAACRHLLILFLSEGPVPTPVFVTGFRPGQSMLVDADSAWTGRYLPAYLRRYPFILGEVADADPFVCLDEAAECLDSSGGEAGLPLFGADGGDTPLLAERIALTRDYADAARRTAAFGQILQEFTLLRPVTVQGRDPETGDTHTLHGARGVDETALAELPDSDLLRLRREGWLAPLYAHLVSLQAIADFNLTYAVDKSVG